MDTGKNEVFVQVTAGDLVGWGQSTYNNEHTDLMDTIANNTRFNETVIPEKTG